MRESSLGPTPRGKKLVVQLQETFREKMTPGFVEKLDAWELMEQAGLRYPPIMIYGDDLTHIVTEEGIAYLNRCRSLEERTAAIRAVAGFTPVGLKADPKETEVLRDRGVVRTPKDLGISADQVSRDLLAAKNIRELVDWSGGLYNPPAKFKNW